MPNTMKAVSFLRRGNGQITCKDKLFQFQSITSGVHERLVKVALTLTSVLIHPELGLSCFPSQIRLMSRLTSVPLHLAPLSSSCFSSL